eukprot:scaffold2.g7389.t1
MQTLSCCLGLADARSPRRSRAALAPCAALPAVLTDTRPLQKPASANHGLDQVEWDLVSHCSRLPGGRGADKCWDAYKWLEAQVAQCKASGDSAEAAECLERLNNMAQQLAGAGSMETKVAQCKASGDSAEAAECLERLNNMAQQLAGAGSMETKVVVLAALAGAERRRLAAEGHARATGAAAAAGDGESANAGAGQIVEKERQARAQLVELFRRMDTNHDGFLSVIEFQQVDRAFATLGGHLDDHTVALVLEALDAQHGRLTLEEEHRTLAWGFALQVVERAIELDLLSVAHLAMDVLPPLPSLGPEAEEAEEAGAGGAAPAAAAAAEGADAAAAAVARRAAAPLFLRCVGPQPRLAVKLAAGYRLALDQFSPAEAAALLDGVSALLDANATAACGVGLLLHFPPLRPHFELDAVIEDLVVSQQHPVVARLLAPLERRHRVAYVGHCLHAAHAVRDWGLEDEYPGVQAAYRRATVDKLAGKGLWGVAAEFAGEDADLREQLVRAMLLAGEALLADQHIDLYRLNRSKFEASVRLWAEVCEEQLERERAERAARFLQLPPADQVCVTYVDSLAALADMQRDLQARLALTPPGAEASAGTQGRQPQQEQDGGRAAARHPPHHGSLHHDVGAAATPAVKPAASTAAPPPAAALVPPPVHYTDAELLPVVGLDCEWKPTESAAQPSLVQLATDGRVWVVDLLALGPAAPQAVSDALRPTMAAPHVGVGIRDDLARLARAHPGAFGASRSCLDLSAAWEDYVAAGAKRATVGRRKRAAAISLSNLAQAVLVTPSLNSAQVSDWERRPLTPGQLTYAALDALAAMLIMRGLAQLHHPLSTRQGLDRHAFHFGQQRQRLRLHEGAGHRSGRGEDGSGDGAGGGGGGAASAGGRGAQRVQPQARGTDGSSAAASAAVPGGAPGEGGSARQQLRAWAPAYACSRGAMRRALLSLPRQLLAWRAV